MALEDWAKGNPPPKLSQPQTPFPADEFNPLTAAFKSYGWSATGGMLGLETKDPNIQKFQRDYPIASTLVDLAGFMTPYVGWAKAAKAIPTVNKAIDVVASAEKLREKPFVSGALKEIVWLAPFEASRVATSVFMGDYLADKLDAYNLGAGTVGKEALANLAIGGVVGGAFEKLLAGGGGIFRTKEQANAFPGLDANDPPQIQLKQMRKALTENQIPQDQIEKALSGINLLRNRILDEMPLKLSDEMSPRAVKILESDKLSTKPDKFKIEAGRQLNRFFRVREGQERGLVVARIRPEVLAGDGYAKIKSLLPDGFEESVQFPRVVRPRTDKSAEGLQQTLTRSLDSVDGALAGYAREGKDGLYVIAKKVTGDVEAKAGDEWLVFKTDEPGRFFPDRAEWQKTLVQRNAWLQDELDINLTKGQELPVWGDVLKLRKELRATDYSGTDFTPGKIGATVSKLMQKADLDPSNSLAYQKMAKFANDYMVPTMSQFTHSPLARVIWAQAKKAYDSGRSVADEIFYGKTEVDVESPLKLFLASDLGKGLKFDQGAVDKLIDNLYAGDGSSIKTFWYAVRNNMSVEEALTKFDLGPLEVSLMRALQKADDMTGDVERQVEKLAGVPESRRFEPLPNHYLISNTWRGTMRTPLWAPGKRLIAVGAGNDSRESYEAALKIQATARANGVELTLGDTIAAGELDADRALRQAIARSQKDPLMRSLYRKIQSQMPDPATYKERRGIGGFIGEDRPWTKQELKDIAHSHLQARWRRIANLTYDSVAKRSRALLMGQDPATYELLAKRVAQIEGHQGPIGKITNDIADKVLAPFMGKNSASRIVSAANQAMFGLELGFMNMSYALANALTFTQTSLPLASFVTSAVPERVANYFTFFPVQGAKTAGHVGVFDIMKLAGKSFKDMVNPEDDLKILLKRAVREGVTDPKFVEDVIGQNSRVAADVKQALQGTEGLGHLIKAWSRIIPGASEKFSRGHSFVIGYRLGKLFHLEDEKLYNWAKEFTEKSMFLYSAADRPMVITGPMGSGYGLFKNWLMHYINWGLTFAGEGVKYGNWAPLMTMIGGTTAVGGLPALVGWGGIDALQKSFSNQTMMQNIYGTFGGDKEHIGLGDAVYYGLPGLLGISLQNQVSMPFADPARDASFIFGLAYWDRMKAIGKMVGDGYDQIVASGRHPGEDPHMIDSFIRAFAPKAIVRAASIHNDAIHSMTTGYPMVDGLGPAQKIMYSMGINPRDIEMGYEVGNELWKDQQRRLAQVQAMGTEWADATEAKDYTKLKEITYRAVTRNIDMSSVIKSAQARLAKGREDWVERQFSPEAVWAYRRLGLY